MKCLRLISFSLLALMASGRSLFACPELFPGLQLCRTRAEFYRAARAAGVTELGVETFEDSARIPVGTYGFIHDTGGALFTPAGFEGGSFFVKQVGGGHALVSRPVFGLTLNFAPPFPRAIGFDLSFPRTTTVLWSSIGAVVSSGFVGFVVTAPIVGSGTISINFTPGAQVPPADNVIMVDNIEYPGGPGSLQVNPQPPVTCPDSVLSGLCFVGTLQPAWYDPPTTVGYRLTALEGKFTSIDDFPTGFSTPFNVSGDGVHVGQFGPGQPVAFPGGATELTVTGITPAVDGSSPLAFPIKLSLDTVGATFVMQPLTQQDIEPPPVVTGNGYNFPETAAYRATFSVSVGGPSPTAGRVQYSYSRTRMNFVSSSISSVDATGSTLTVQGIGTVNGVAGYSFIATVTDGSPDAFGIVIRRPDGSIYYLSPALALAGGAFTLL